MNGERIEILGQEEDGTWSVASIAAEELPGLIRKDGLKALKCHPCSENPGYRPRKYTQALIPQSVLRQLGKEIPDIDKPISNPNIIRLLDILGRMFP